LGENNQSTPEVQAAGSYTNMLAAKTETSLESICSASLGQKREQSRRAGRTHSNENPKHCPNVSRRVAYPSKGLRTPRLPSRPDISDLQKNVVSAASARRGQNELDEPHPPVSTDSHKTGSCKWLSRSTVKWIALAWLVRRPLGIDYLDCGTDATLRVSS